MLSILATIIVLAMVLDLEGCDSGHSPISHTCDWGNWSVTTFPTCITDGIETRSCVIDSSHKETRSVIAHGHVWEFKKGLAPTCT